MFLGGKIKNNKYLNNYIDKFEKKVIEKAIKIALRTSPKKWMKILNFAEKVDLSGEYKPAIAQVKKTFAHNHPSVQYIEMLKNKAPACRDKFLTNFFIRACFEGAEKRKKFVQSQNADYRPFFFVISPTMRCNLNCLGCYAGNYKKNDDLPFEVVDKIFSEAQEMGIYFITVSGGEPFFRKDLLDLFEKHNKVYFQVYTNGSLIDKELAEKIVKLGNVAPVISIEGLEKENEQRRGEGIFKKICQALDNLKEAGAIYGFSAMPTKLNFDCLKSDEFYQFLVEKGCLFGWFFQYIPIGRNVDLDLMIKPAQRLAIYQKVKEIRNKYPLFIADFWNDGKYTKGCIAGAKYTHGYFHINSKGDIEPCVFAHFAQDNIIDLYQQGKHLWDGLNSDFFKRIRAGQPWNKDHRMPCMIVDNPQCLRRVVKESGAYPTHSGAETLVEDPKIVEFLNDYSQTMSHLCQQNKKVD